jgi:exodeoxyribonuclease VII small subunit
MAAGKDKDINLEQALGELESLVEEMESGDLPLEEAMKKFERGITLTRECQTALRDAEQKVEVLMKKAGGGEETGPFEPGE